MVAVALLPALGLAVAAARGALGANPVETLTHVTGEWALRLLLASPAGPLTSSPDALGRPGLAPFRRIFGLLAFGYAVLHLLTWLLLEHTLAADAILEDILERPFVTAGAVSFLCMLPLALTSTRRAVRRLGRRWVQLHRLVYLAAAAAVVHFLWLVKADLRAPLVHGAVLAVLLGLRWLPARRRAGASSS